MAKAIKSEDIFEKGIFSETVAGANQLLAVIRGIKKSIDENIKSQKVFLQSFKEFSGGKDLDAFNKSLSETTRLLEKRDKIEQQEIKTKTLLAKKESEEEKAKQEKIKTQDKANKSSEQAAKNAEKEAKAYQKANSEYKKASDALSDLKKRLKDLSISGKENTKEFNELNKQFKDLDSKVRKADASAGDFQRNVGNYPGQLREIQRELAKLEPGSEEFNRLAQKAGRLKDSIQDAKEATKAFASESKTGQAKTLFTQIGSDLANLDFKGAAEKAKVFSSVVKSISFGEVVSGIKDFASAILSVGKALLVNPFTIMLAAIGALVYDVYEVIDVFNSFGDAAKSLNESLDNSKKKIEELTDKQAEYLVRIAVATGKMTKAQGELAKNDIKNNKERLESGRAYSEQVLALAKSLDLDLGELQGNRFDEEYTGDLAKTLRKKKFNEDLIILEKQYKKEQKELVKTQLLERQADIDEAATEEKKKRADELKDKLKEIAKNNKDLRNQLEQLRIDQIKDDTQKQIEQLQFNNRLAKEKIKEEVADQKLKNLVLAELDKKLQADITKVQEDARRERAAKLSQIDNEIKKNQTSFEIESEQEALTKITEANKATLTKQLEDENAFSAKLEKKRQQQIDQQKKDIETLYDLKQQQIEDQAAFDTQAIKNGTESEEIKAKEIYKINEKLKLDLAKLNGDRLADEIKANDDSVAQQKELLKKQIQIAAGYSNKALGLISEEFKKESDLRTQNLDKQITDRQKNIDTQQKLAERGLDNTLAFEKEQLAKQELQREQEKQREVKRQKNIAFLRLLAGYAESGNPSSALRKATVDMVLAQVISAAFKDGAEKIDGPGTEKSDSIIARLSKNESVINAEGTRENPGLATAMNTGQTDTYFEENYLPKYLLDNGISAPTKSSYDSVMVKQLHTLNNRIIGLEKAILNKREQNVNWDNHGNLVVSEVESGIRRTVKYMKQRPRI